MSAVPAWRSPRATILAAIMALAPAERAMAQATSGVRDAEVRYAAALTSGDAETAASFFDAAAALSVTGCPGI